MQLNGQIQYSYALNWENTAHLGKYSTVRPLQMTVVSRPDVLIIQCGGGSLSLCIIKNVTALLEYFDLERISRS